MKFYISTCDEKPHEWVLRLANNGITLGHVSLNNLINDVADWLPFRDYSYDLKFFEYEKTVYIKDNIETFNVKFIREIPLAEIKKLIMLR